MPGPIYERLPNESEQAYRAFLIYRDLGADRTLEKARKTLGKREGYLTVLEKWSFTHKWVERCREWDNHLQAERDEVARAEVRKWEARRLRRIEQNYEQAQKLRAKAEEMLRHSTARVVKKETYADGREKTIVLEPVRFRHKDAAAMLGVADQLERDAIREALPAQSGPDGGDEVDPKAQERAERALGAALSCDGDDGDDAAEGPP